MTGKTKYSKYEPQVALLGSKARSVFTEVAVPFREHEKGVKYQVPIGADAKKVSRGHEKGVKYQ